ncbi:MAG: response regulator transcription factor [bacterium]|nr:response regulator transcription factor [bacterium]MCM1374361.1 response regulator transcription factor [Muribaculum sp.]
MYTILVVDDEPKIVELLEIYLHLQGYRVLTAGNGRQAWEIWKSGEEIHLILADIMMPEMDGYRLVENIREDSTVPILYITARTDVSDRIKGLGLGTDDYIVKPFEPAEVVARVAANLRRCYGYAEAEGSGVLTCRDIELDAGSGTVRVGGRTLELTAMEYRIMKFFMENQGRVLTRNQIYEAAWKENEFPDDNSIMVAISKLRAKLGDEEKHYIRTVRGLGYRLEQV